jgi:hypothetical protein
MTRSIEILLTRLIDYAGLFPPAKLSMEQSVETFNRARVGGHERLLGRFICPVSKLQEFSKYASAFLPGTFATSGYREHAEIGEPWRLSVLLDGSLEQDLDVVEGFNMHHSAEDNGQAVIDAVEVKLADVQQIDVVLDELPDDLFPYFEFPVNADCRGYVAALAGSQAAAKIRTGGVAAGSFPTPQEVAQFIVACSGADVPFKATAGLHHPVRASHRLTYEKESASCVMHGFLNVFLCAALVRMKGLDVERAEAVLLEEDAASFVFSDELVTWRGHGLDAIQLAEAREHFALSFGSCSFDEPIADLKRLGLL